MTAKTPAAASATTAVPALVPYTGAPADPDWKAGARSVTFLIYKDEQGGEALWGETQTVSLDQDRHYRVQLGSTLAKGLPEDLFSSGEARWLEVQVAGDKPQPRVLLLSVPYAMKAADSATLGGLPASAFALAGSPSVSAPGSAFGEGAVAPDASSSTVTTPGGTAGYLPVFSGATAIDDSVVFQSGANVGIDTKNPATTLDVDGTVTARGGLTLQDLGAATPAGGKNSASLDFLTSLYNSAEAKEVFPVFSFKAEPAANNTATPGATLNLLYGGNGGTPAETGLSINAKGIVKFAAGQTFPGSGGTITGVTAGTGLQGGGTSGSVTLSLNPSLVPTLTGSPVFSSSGTGATGDTSGTTLNTAGLLGVAGSRTSASGIAGVWGDAYSHVGVLGSSHDYSGVQGISVQSYGVQGASTSNTGVLGQSTSGTGVSGLSTTNSGVAGYTPGSTINTAGVLGKAGSTSGILSIVAGVWGDSYQNVGVEGTSNQSVGVYGQSSTTMGVEGVSTNGTGVAGNSTNGAGMVGYTGGNYLNTAGTFGIAGNRTSFAGIAGVWGDADAHVGVFGSSNSFSGVQGSSTTNNGVFGSSVSGPGVSGSSTSGNGVRGVSANTSAIFGQTSSTSGGDAALYGYSTAGAIGVFGFSPRVGVYGASGGASRTGGLPFAFENGVPGVWGDTNGAGYGLAGTADNAVAGEFVNESSSQPTLEVNNLYGIVGVPFAGPVASIYGGTGGCTFFANGDLTCTGTVSSDNAVEGGARAVKTYGVQSAESWSEDAGTGQLVNGVAHVILDPTFGQTVNTSVAYHVFLTPGGDSDGLYVSNKTAQGFDVHEQHGGHSSIAFDYRIMAKRAGHENERLVDVTEEMKKQAEKRARMRQSVKRTDAPRPGSPVAALQH